MNTIKRVILREGISNNDLKKKQGHFFNDEGYIELNENCDCYDVNNNFICSIRKNVFDKDIVDNLDNLYFNLNCKRGLSSGKINPDNIKMDNFELCDDFRFCIVRKTDGKVSNFKLNNPVRSNVVGYYDYRNYKEGSNSIGITKNSNEKSLDSIEKLTRACDKLYRQLQPKIYNDTMKDLVDKGFKEFLYGDCLSTTITCNTDFRTGLHKDSNNYNKIGMMAVLNDSEEKFNGGELLLPRFKAKCCLEAGDFIIFDSDTFHTNNAIVGGKRFSFVFYIRSNIVKLYDKDTKVIRRYTGDLFIDYSKPAILLIDKYNPHKEVINKYARDNGLTIYRMSASTSFNRRKFGDNEIRYINKKNLEKFEKPIFLRDIVDKKSTKTRLKKVKREIIVNELEKIKTKNVCSLKKSLDFWIRPNTTDRKSIKEVIEQRCYQNRNIKFGFDESDVWLDLGMNIGAFTCLVMNWNVKKVVSLEPEKSNFDLAIKNIFLQKNSKTKNTLINKAVSLKGGNTKLYLCKSNYNKYRHTIVETKRTLKWKSIDIESVSLKDLLHSYPDVNCIKMDIEGAEFDIMEQYEFKNINKLVVEWSFDFDYSVKRFKDVVELMKKYFNVVHYRKILAKEGLENYYPKCIVLFCKN